MQTLESYLSEGIYRDREDIIAVERVLCETGKTIDVSFCEQFSDWPYEIISSKPDSESDNKPERTSGDYSQSTSAMMINAIDLLRGTTQGGGRKAPYPFDLGEIGTTLKEKRRKAFKKLIQKIKKPKAKAQQDSQPTSDKLPAVTSSGTYGRNDPLTLSFLAEIISAPGGECPTWLSGYAKTAANDLLKFDPAKESSQFFYFEPKKKGGTSTPLSNAFVPLRIIRACSKLNVPDLRKSKYLSYFESTLHDQLSYSSIPDSRFDPAELIFCLEGVLRVSEQSVDTPMFERVLDVLEAAQQTSAHWRPNKPFLRNERGLVLFPVSVEAANSLLWSCATLDKNERFYRYSERYIALFRRFWGWLAARRVTLETGLSGWHSDHVADPDSIQLWDTAQVVDFLLGYRRSLHNHIARTTLRLARFAVRQPKTPSDPWSEATRELERRFRSVSRSCSAPGAAGAETKDTTKIQAAEKDTSPQGEDPPSTVVASFEPVTSLESYFKTYEKIEKAFLRGWLEEKPSNFSMLLYGPPGTGKTTVAENLADALGFPMITITVSDFLAEGGGGIEARAKMIFDVLEAQANYVILFDEIDELVLDRSSERQEKQDTVFKFMTPGMLTKLNNLRRAERSIFIMATNYAYRIDPAIRRTGRIDENYLLLPPDAEARKRMIKGFLEHAVKERKLNKTDKLYPQQLAEQAWDTLVQASFFLSYTDIKAAVSRVLRNVPRKRTVNELKRELLTWGRTTTLLFYKKALVESVDRKAVAREFLALVQMAALEGEVAAQEDSALDIETFVKEAKDLVYASPTILKACAVKFVKKQNDSGGAIQ